MTGHPPPGMAPHQPRRTQPLTGRAKQGGGAGPRHPHTCTHSRWVANPGSPPRGRAAGRREAPESRPASQRPSATPTARKGGLQGHTLWGRCWVPTPTPTAPWTHGSRNPGRPPQRAGGWRRDSALHQTPLRTVEGQPPRGRHPTTQDMQAKGTVLGLHRHTPAPTARGWQTTTARPEGGQPEEGKRLNSDARPSQRQRASPPGTPSRHPDSAQQRLATALAEGPMLGPLAHTNHNRDTWVAEPRLPTPQGGRLGEG